LERQLADARDRCFFLQFDNGLNVLHRLESERQQFQDDFSSVTAENEQLRKYVAICLLLVIHFALLCCSEVDRLKLQVESQSQPSKGLSHFLVYQS